MKSYKCEDVILSTENTSKGVLCNPEEKGKKPAVIVLGPQCLKEDKVSIQYATRLADYGYITLCLGETKDIKSAIDYLSFNEEVDPGKVYAVGICNGTNEVINLAEKGRLKAVALVAGCYNQKEASHLNTPTIVIHGGEKSENFECAREVYQTIRAEDKMAIWEESVSHSQYYDDPSVLDKTVKNVYRWFNTH